MEDRTEQTIKITTIRRNYKVHWTSGIGYDMSLWKSSKKKSGFGLQI